jgi:hypothetical protein
MCARVCMPLEIALRLRGRMFCERAPPHLESCCFWASPGIQDTAGGRVFPTCLQVLAAHPRLPAFEPTSKRKKDTFKVKRSKHDRHSKKVRKAPEAHR